MHGQVIWFTGLSGAGKSTLCEVVAQDLREVGRKTQTLDADFVRRELCADLTFSISDRFENIRRISFLAHLLEQHGIIVLVAAISPLREMRAFARARCEHFVEVFVDSPLEICEARDVKGLYARARAGEIAEFTGIDSVYENPLSAEVTCYTAVESVRESADKIVQLVLHSSYGCG